MRGPLEVGWGYSARLHRSRLHNRHRCNTRQLAGIEARRNLPCSTAPYRRNRHRHRPPPAGNRTGRFPHRRRCSIHRPSSTDRDSGNSALRRSRCHSSRRRRSTRLLPRDNSRSHIGTSRPGSSILPRTASEYRDRRAVLECESVAGRPRSRRTLLCQRRQYSQFRVDPSAGFGESRPGQATEPARRTDDRPRQHASNPAHAIPQRLILQRFYFRTE